MKLEIIKGRNGCQEIDIDIENINGVTSDRELRILFFKNKRYRLTLKSYNKLVNILRSPKWINKCLMY